MWICEQFFKQQRNFLSAFARCQIKSNLFLSVPSNNPLKQLFQLEIVVNISRGKNNLFVVSLHIGSNNSNKINLQSFTENTMNKSNYWFNSNSAFFGECFTFKMLNKNVFDFYLVSENSNWLRLDLNFVPLRIFRDLKNRKRIISSLKSGHFCQLERDWLTIEESCINEMFRNYSYGGNWTDLKVIPK